MTAAALPPLEWLCPCGEWVSTETPAHRHMVRERLLECGFVRDSASTPAPPVVKISEYRRRPDSPTRLAKG